MGLNEEIAERRSEIRSDGYPMSIGELMNLYRDGELDIHPEFQRFFRWSDEQKSRLVESILLGIPIPSVFVSQREDGVWDVMPRCFHVSTLKKRSFSPLNMGGSHQSSTNCVSHQNT